MKRKNDKTDEDKDVLKDLGDFIEQKFKRGVTKIEEIFTDDKDSDDKLFKYFKVFIDDKGVASVTPSSKYLVNKVLKAMSLTGGRKVIVEFGAADGVITKKLLEKLSPDSVLLSIELNDKLYEQLKLIKDPRLKTYHGDVRQFDKIMKELGVNEAPDIVFSGIPFAFLSGRGRHELLLKISETLKPTGRFVAYQVTTHLIPLLKDYFKKVKTDFEIRNIPPHFVFTALK
jgi:phospholipid N-methyltransferase